MRKPILSTVILVLATLALAACSAASSRYPSSSGSSGGAHVERSVPGHLKATAGRGEGEP